MNSSKNKLKISAHPKWTLSLSQALLGVLKRCNKIFFGKVWGKNLYNSCGDLLQSVMLLGGE